LQVLIQARPQIETIHLVEDSTTVLDLSPEILPALILLDDEMPGDELRKVLSQFKATWPRTWCVVFLEAEQDRQQAVDAGADVVLLKGMRADTILDQI
jgi:DNA-binding NarL/FixJ family response regulator